MRRVAIAIPLALFIGAACAVGTPSALAPSPTVIGSAAPSAIALALPKPIPQRITRTSPAAQNAWVFDYATPTGPGNSFPTLVGVGPDAQVVGRIDLATVDTGRVARSADGAELWALGADQLTVFSALDGKRLRAYDVPSAIADGTS